MFPHQNNSRERRVGQPPMPPQHILGMPQQGPAVISMPMPTQQIMTANHYTNQNSYTPQGQGNVSSYVPTQVHQQKIYHQAPYNHNSPQVIITKQANNRNKNYRKDFNVMQDSLAYNINERNNQQNNYINNEYNMFSKYHHGHNNNGYYTAKVQKVKENIPYKHGNSKEAPKEKDVAVVVKSESPQECPVIPQTLVAGAKEKTPMCLVNELARFNKITHQYRLTNEQGPAHKKSFTVTLTLGTEEYTAEGPSIKKAQHCAAAEALAKTLFSHPTPKTTKNNHSGKPNITPTVELNALAMKRGEPAIYKLLETSQNQQILQAHGPSFGYRRPYYGRSGRVPVKAAYASNVQYTVSLKVGSWEFFGEGISPQLARHDAASKALNQIKMLPLPEENTRLMEKENGFNGNQDFDSLIKSPISLVYEIALKRDMGVSFEVVSDRGPPHMKVFVTKCTVGHVIATGEGNGKKISKKRAAENMLTELKKLPPLSPTLPANSTNPTKGRKRFSQGKKKSRSLVKVVQNQKTEQSLTEDVNPISRLLQIQQLKKEKEPLYALLEEKGSRKKREFLMQVSVDQLSATGTGPNKKLAKKAAAQNLLNVMGYGNPGTNNTNSETKNSENPQAGSKERKVTFVETEKGTENHVTSGSTGRQLKPGILVMPACDQHCASNSPSAPLNLQTTATIARELLKEGNSPTADALVQKSVPTKGSSQSTSQSFRPKDQLLYLADLLNFQVHFSDFPKGNHSEFLSLVTMSTDPSHVCHGSGPTVEESQDQAALTALTALSEMGLDSVTSSNPTKEIKPKGSKTLQAVKK